MIDAVALLLRELLCLSTLTIIGFCVYMIRLPPAQATVAYSLLSKSRGPIGAMALPDDWSCYIDTHD